MRKPQIGLWLILAITLIVCAVMSLHGTINLEFTTLKTATFATSLLGPTHDKSAKPAPKPAPAKEKHPLDTAAKNILFIGDSMLEGLSPRMAAYAKKNGHTLTSVIWYSSSTEIWGSSNRLQAYIAQFRPNYILICLGANELFVANIKEKRQPFVCRLLAQVGSIPYVWIGPPNWKPDTGINDLIESSVKPGCFYLSAGQQFERKADGAHPTAQSAADWADRVCVWITTESAHPIRLARPDTPSAHCRTLVLQPNQR